MEINEVEANVHCKWYAHLYDRDGSSAIPVNGAPCTPLLHVIEELSILPWCMTLQWLDATTQCQCRKQNSEIICNIKQLMSYCVCKI